jgi:hypothetical protein
MHLRMARMPRFRYPGMLHAPILATAVTDSFEGCYPPFDAFNRPRADDLTENRARARFFFCHGVGGSPHP